MKRFLQMVDANGNPALPGSVANLVPGGRPWPPQTPHTGVVKETGPYTFGGGRWALGYEWVVGGVVYTFDLHSHQRPNVTAVADGYLKVVRSINASQAYEMKPCEWEYRVGPERYK